MTTTERAEPHNGARSGVLVALSALGAVVMSAAWCWYGLAFFEEMTEQPKAVSAGTTMAGSGAVLGIPPLVIAHVLGLIVLVLVAPRGRRIWPGLGWAVLGVGAASIIGIIVAQLLWGGDLFRMSATMQPEFIP